MKLEDQFHDPNSRNVLSALRDAIDTFDRHPLLVELRSEHFPIHGFGFVTKARLDAATNFVPFLSATEEKTSQRQGWQGVAYAMRSNLDEELGMVNGIYINEKSHDTWRTLYRGGMRRILNERGISFDEIDVRVLTDDISTAYGKPLQAMPTEHDVPYLVGAFTVLEGMLEKEFTAMLSYIRRHLQELTTDEVLYISHHAGHEQRHFADVAEPLLVQCARSPHIVSSVIAGIEDMASLRSRNVLGKIMNFSN